MYSVWLILPWRCGWFGWRKLRGWILWHIVSRSGRFGTFGRVISTVRSDLSSCGKWVRHGENKRGFDLTDQCSSDYHIKALSLNCHAFKFPKELMTLLSLSAFQRLKIGFEGFDIEALSLKSHAFGTSWLWLTKKYS